MSRKRDEFWAIQDERSDPPMIFTGTALTRNDAIAQLLWNYYGPKVKNQFASGRSLRPEQKRAWDKLYREGYRAVRVRVEVI